VVCGGNHDRLFQLSRLTARELLSDAIPVYYFVRERLNELSR
jgi:hypothetical protein